MPADHDASPADAPYIVIPGVGQPGAVQVRNVFAGPQVAIVQPLPGQYIVGVAGVEKGGREGSAYVDSVVEYSTRTGRPLANVAPPVSSPFPGTLCVPLWTNRSGEQVITSCGHPEKYDHGHVTRITLHPPMYGTDIQPFGWQPGSPGT